MESGDEKKKVAAGYTDSKHTQYLYLCHQMQNVKPMMIVSLFIFQSIPHIKWAEVKPHMVNISKPQTTIFCNQIWWGYRPLELQ